MASGVAETRGVWKEDWFHFFMCCLWQAAADFEASADSSKDRDDDEETDLSQAQEMEQDASDDDDNLDGKPTNNYFA